MEAGLKKIANMRGNWVAGLLMLCVMGMVGNFIGFKVLFADSIPGMLILFAIAVVSLVIEAFFPSKFPTIAYTSLVGIIAALPFFPGSQYIVKYVGQIQLMAIVTPILAYAGLIVGRDWGAFKKIGWKGTVVGIIVLFATFFWSCLISELILRWQGVI